MSTKFTLMGAASTNGSIDLVQYNFRKVQSSGNLWRCTARGIKYPMEVRIVYKPRATGANGVDRCRVYIKDVYPGKNGTAYSNNFDFGFAINRKTAEQILAADSYDGAPHVAQEALENIFRLASNFFAKPVVTSSVQNGYVDTIVGRVTADTAKASVTLGPDESTAVVPLRHLLGAIRNGIYPELGDAPSTAFSVSQAPNTVKDYLSTTAGQVPMILNAADAGRG